MAGGCSSKDGGQAGMWVAVLAVRALVRAFPAAGRVPVTKLDSIAVTVESRSGFGPLTRGVLILTREELSSLPVRFPQ